ncbi:hypothetical protein [Streptomyces sp. bgisy091]|uniref:hypothetical protein n=1 Tax=Streptomyces sp. bgisy091 TaxID=3413778 RepID=UPI003D7626AB
MPATLTAPRTAPASSVTSGALSVEDLSNGERKIALYASDMPGSYSYRRGDGPQLMAWIIQGAARLGLEELYRSAAYDHSYRVLSLANLATDEQARAHRARFVNSRRLNRAGSAATITGLGQGAVPYSAAAVARSKRPLVEGTCHCGSTGWFEVCFDPDDATANASQNCPAHNPTGHLPGPSVSVVA